MKKIFLFVMLLAILLVLSSCFALRGDQGDLRPGDPRQIRAKERGAGIGRGGGFVACGTMRFL